MNFQLLDPTKVQPLHLLDENHQIRLRPAAFYDSLDQASLAWWCNRNARYGLPTIETVDWLREQINGRFAIEIGAGAGDLAYHLGIVATDSRIQEDPTVQMYYAAARQVPVSYPNFVQKADAMEAVRAHNPEVVVASWVTEWIDPNKPVPPGGGSIFGVKEQELIATGIPYIFIGSRRVHGRKASLGLPHQEYDLPFLRSRTSGFDPADVVYVWNR